MLGSVRSFCLSEVLFSLRGNDGHVPSRAEGDSSLFHEDLSLGYRDCLIRRISLSMRTGCFSVAVGSSDEAASDTDTSTRMHRAGCL
jgi:hypothetical protein